MEWAKHVTQQTVERLIRWETIVRVVEFDGRHWDLPCVFIFCMLFWYGVWVGKYTPNTMMIKFFMTSFF